MRRQGLHLVLLSVAGLLAAPALGRAAAPGGVATSNPGFVEVPDDTNQAAIEIEPNGTIAVPPAPKLASPVSRLARSRPVAAPVPAPPLAVAQAPIRSPATPASVTPGRPAEQLTDQLAAPPLAVTISFPRGRAGARAKADAVAQTLRSHGMPVDDVEADGHVAARARIVFGFEEDRPAASQVSATLQAAYGVSSPLTLSPGPPATTRPGLIQVALPG